MNRSHSLYFIGILFSLHPDFFKIVVLRQFEIAIISWKLRVFIIKLYMNLLVIDNYNWETANLCLSIHHSNRLYRSPPPLFFLIVYFYPSSTSFTPSHCFNFPRPETWANWFLQNNLNKKYENRLYFKKANKKNSYTCVPKRLQINGHILKNIHVYPNVCTTTDIYFEIQVFI